MLEIEEVVSEKVVRALRDRYTDEEVAEIIQSSSYQGYFQSRLVSKFLLGDHKEGLPESIPAVTISERWKERAEQEFHVEAEERYKAQYETLKAEFAELHLPRFAEVLFDELRGIGIDTRGIRTYDDLPPITRRRLDEITEAVVA